MTEIIMLIMSFRDTMPPWYLAFVRNVRPPKECPVCMERIWSTRGEMPNEAWRVYNIHLREYHPGYKRWNTRLSFLYVIPILLSIGTPVIVAVFEGNPIPPPGRPIIISALVLAAVAVGVIILIKQRGRHRFRELWDQEHPLAK